MNDNVKALRAFLDQPDAVIFVGSGLSVWSGLPAWESVIRGLIGVASLKGLPCQVAEDFLSGKQLLDAADAIQLTSSEISNVMRTELGFSSARPHDVHALLMKLGPKRFVTTNFDTLLEQQLGLNGDIGEFRVVSSRQVAELADIVKASADRFIFKPHGDLSEAESLVLSSRDYDRLIGGETNQVRRALETIMISRPVLFVGYGLRDPDTRLILRTLVDRYVGNVGHFAAIMPNATSEHRDYWWSRYRIRVYSYSTSIDASGKQDHSEFRALLTSLVTSNFASSKIHSQAVSEKRSVAAQPDLAGSAALMRYAARLVRPEPARRYPVHVWFRDLMSARPFVTAFSRFQNSSISELLCEAPQTFILSGTAGSGKSFAISQFLSDCGRALISSDNLHGEETDVLIPLLLDARLYNGSFKDLAGVTIPKEIDLQQLSIDCTIVVILDSIDEMPAEQLDSARWIADFEAFISQFRKVRVTYSTRRADLVGRSELPVFSVRGLPNATVIDAMLDVGVDASGLSFEFRESLQNPFLLSLAQRQLPRGPQIRSAPDLIRGFLEAGIGRIRASDARECIEQLAELAKFLTSGGRETVSLTDLEARLSKMSRERSRSHLMADDLVSAGIMVSEIDSHVRFVHRTITEYLASTTVLSKGDAEGIDIHEKLSTHRWDNAIAWAISEAEASDAQGLLRRVCNVDLSLGYRIAAFSEVNGSKLWAAFIDSVQGDLPSDTSARDAFYSIEDEISLPREVAPRLKSLLHLDHVVGGWAAGHYAAFASESELKELIDQIIFEERDYGYHQFATGGISASLSQDLLEYVLSLVETLGVSDENDPRVDGAFGLIERLTHENARSVLEWGQKGSVGVRRKLCWAVRDYEGHDADRFLLRQFDNGIVEAERALFMRIAYKHKRVTKALIPRFTERRMQRIADSILADGRRSHSGLDLLRILIKRDWRWSDAAKLMAKNHPNPHMRRALRVVDPFGLPRAKEQFVRSLLKRVKSISELERAVVSVISGDDFAVDEDAILNSLTLNGAEVVEIVAELFFRFGRSNVVVSEKNLDRWIHMLCPLASPESVNISWICTYLADAFADRGRQHLLDRANDTADSERDFILGYLILRMPTVTVDDLTEVARNRLFDLYIDGDLEPWPSPGHIATERFVLEDVLRRAELVGSDKFHRDAIEIILDEAGQRHDRRYFAPWQIR